MPTVDELLRKTEDRLKQLKQRKQKQESKRKTIEAASERKNNKRRKYLVGALVLREMNQHQETRDQMLSELNKFLTRNTDRALFGLSAVVENQDIASHEDVTTG